MLLPKLGGFWLLPPRDFPHLSESHPMDHDSNSSGHTDIKARPHDSDLTPSSSLELLSKRNGLLRHQLHIAQLALEHLNQSSSRPPES